MESMFCLVRFILIFQMWCMFGPVGFQQQIPALAGQAESAPLLVSYPGGRWWHSVCRTCQRAPEISASAERIYSWQSLYLPGNPPARPTWAAVSFREPLGNGSASLPVSVDMERLPFHPLHRAQKAEPLFYLNWAFVFFWTLGKQLLFQSGAVVLQNLPLYEVLEERN